MRKMLSSLAFLHCVGCIEYSPDDEVEAPGPPLVEPAPLLDLAGHDEIRTPDPDPVDILAIVDNSCSMDDNQGNLASNILKLFGPVIASGTPFHVGVTTTDADTWEEAGIISWVPSDWSYAPLLEVIETLMRPGILGSGTERPAEAFWSAIKKADEANLGFFTDGATLHVILITDEVDSTDDAHMENFHALLRRLARDKRMTFSSIVRSTDAVLDPELPGCAADYDHLFVRIAEEFGTLVDICSPDWSPAIEVMADSFVDPQTLFYLEENPAHGSLSVSVEYADPDSPTGVTTIVPGPSAWEYKAGMNAVEFTDEFPVRYLWSSTIVLDYEVAD